MTDCIFIVHSHQFGRCRQTCGQAVIGMRISSAQLLWQSRH